ncbi:uncharacterized protein [Temnothorax longispinosus]|uniref:uncharacterized protein n=1 Tax=Temnothorax longispinosus TaxID=300112 RepID=UPI003A9A25CF
MAVEGQAAAGRTGYVGYIAEYSSEELFASYVKRFEQFVSVNDVPDAKKVPLFLTMIGPKCYDVLRNSVAPDKPASTKTYDALKKVLLDYYTPEKCIIAERYRFHKRFQKTEETVTQFGVELKKLAQYCNFGTFLDDALRDQFVCGIVSKDTRRKLLVKPDLTYNSAVKEAVSMELAGNQTKEFASDTVHSISKGSTNNASNYKKKQSFSDQKNKGICIRCGGPWRPEHLSECKARNVTCHACGIKGHFGKQMQEEESASSSSAT